MFRGEFTGQGPLLAGNFRGTFPYTSEPIFTTNATPSVRAVALPPIVAPLPESNRKAAVPAGMVPSFRATGLGLTGISLGSPVPGNRVR